MQDNFSNSKTQSVDTDDVFARKHLPALDGLRFVAVMLVILNHGELIHVGGDGVTIFFVLSGFLFSWLFCKQWEKKGTIDFKRFYYRRTLRIMPACIFCLIFTVVAKITLEIPVDYAHAFSALTYTANYYNAFFDHPPSGFSHFWSLAVEEQFYLVWPIVFYFFMKRSRKSLKQFLVISIVCIGLWRSWLTLSLHVSEAWLYNAFDTRIDSIAIGCLFGLLIQEEWFRATLKKLTFAFWTPIVPITLLCITHVLPSWFHYSAGLSIDSILMGIVVLQLIILSEHPIWNWLNSKPIKFGGVLSYSMYLYHPWGLAVGWKLAFLPLFLQIIVATVATVILAACSYYLIELPFQRLRDGKTRNASKHSLQSLGNAVA